MGKLFLITGNDDFAVKNQVREIVCNLCGDPPDDNPELEIIRGDSDDLKPEEILTACYAAIQTPPFLCAEKKVWLKHFQHFEKVLENSGKDGKAGRIDDITALIKAGLPDDVTLIIDGPDIDKRKAFFKACKDQGEIFIFEKADITSRDFSRNQFVRIQDLAAKAGLTIEPDAVSYLMETIGSDSGRLTTELEKLSCFLLPRKDISLQDCKNICSRTPEAISWDFAKALTARDIPRALEMVDTLVQQLRNERGNSSNSELSLLHQAVSTFQEMVQTRCAAAELGVPPRPSKNWFYNLREDVKAAHADNFLVRIHPFRAYMLCENAASFSDLELVNAMNALLNANRQLVSGGAEPRLALEQLVLRVAGTRPSARA